MVICLTKKCDNKRNYIIIRLNVKVVFALMSVSIIVRGGDNLNY